MRSRTRESRTRGSRNYFFCPGYKLRTKMYYKYEFINDNLIESGCLWMFESGDSCPVKIYFYLCRYWDTKEEIYNPWIPQWEQQNCIDTFNLFPGNRGDISHMANFQYEVSSSESHPHMPSVSIGNRPITCRCNHSHQQRQAPQLAA